MTCSARVRVRPCVDGRRRWQITFSLFFFFLESHTTSRLGGRGGGKDGNWLRGAGKDAEGNSGFG